MFCCTLLYVHSSIAIILMGKRELIAWLGLSSWCPVMVERLFLAVPRGCLQFVIVVFPDHTHLLFLYPPQTLFVGGILFSRCPSVRACVRPSVRPSVTLCFLNNSKSHCWIFIKPCKHVHICKTNTLDKKVRARGQFY